jgi:hypothetical protein
MKKNIFLQKHTKIEDNVSSAINLILSPTYYWVKEFELPITSIKEVQKVVPNLFEDFFDITNYKFYVQKIEENKYLCFAYDEELILNALVNANIDNKKISNIYFAQNEFKSFFNEELNALMNINDEYFIYQKNILINIPNILALNLDNKVVDLEEIEFSKFKISINKSSKYMSNKYAYILSSIIIVFAILVFTKSISINQSYLKYESKISKLKKLYSLPNSMIQTKSIIKQYNKVEDKYTKTRNAFLYIINFKLHATGTLKSCEFRNGMFTLIYANTDIDKIKYYISKKYNIKSINVKNNHLRIEVKI